MPQVEVIGIYRADPQEPVHVVELRVHDARGVFSIGEFTQELPGAPKSDWPVAHFEQILSADGAQIVADDTQAWRKAELFQGDVRLVFLFRSLDVNRPLRTPFGEVALPAESELPERLVMAFSAVQQVPMMSWRARTITFAAGAVAVAVLQVAFFDTAQRSPRLLSPPQLFFNSITVFLLVNIAAFCVNVLKSLVSVQGCKDEHKIEEMTVPAFQGHITDNRILRYTDLPFFASLGAIFAAGLIWILR